MFLLALGALTLFPALGAAFDIWTGTLHEIAGTQTKALQRNGAHGVDLVKSNRTSAKEVLYRAMATGDIVVIEVLVCVTTYTQHSPSGLVLCMCCITH